jgi:hypothetical protein
MGNYAGAGGRLVWRSGPLVGSLGSEPNKHIVVEPAPYGEQPGAITANWRISLKVTIDGAFTPGSYLFQIRGSDGGRAWIPLVVRDSVGAPTIGVLLATNTWQAYNTWGGASAYRGADSSTLTRSRIVSFDRPYAGTGDGGFVADELPFVQWAEGLDADVTYFTDQDMELGSPLLSKIKLLVVPGHAEYWTSTMRSNLERLVIARGGNVAFLGANNIYWRPRLTSAVPGGPARELAIFRSPAEDVVSDPSQVSIRWRDAPISTPEQQILGSQYWCNGVDTSYVIPDNPGWPFAWGGLTSGTEIPHLAFDEVDHVYASLPQQPGLRALAQAPVTCASGDQSYPHEWDAIAYETPANGAVISMGTLGWTCELTGICPRQTQDPVTIGFVQKVTEEILRALSRGPAGLIVRSAGTAWQPLPAPSATPTPTPTGSAP